MRFRYAAVLIALCCYFAGGQKQWICEIYVVGEVKMFEKYAYMHAFFYCTLMMIVTSNHL